MKTLAAFIFVFLVSGGDGSCASDNFQYEDNSRLVIEGFLKDSINQPVANAHLLVGSYHNSSIIQLGETYSASDGFFSVSVPNGNHSIGLKIRTKKLCNTQNSILQCFDYLNVTTQNTTNNYIYYPKITVKDSL